MPRLLVTAAWIVWAAPTLPWLVAGWARSAEGWAQGLVAALAVALVARPQAAPDRIPARALAFLAAGPAVAALAPSSDAAHAAGAALAGYGVLALWWPADEWRARAALPWLAWSVLPVTPVVDAIVGWPLRKAAASAAAAALGGLATETVIAVEGAAAKVDAPCAGLHGAWALVALALLASLERRHLGPRAALAVALGVAVGFAGNVARIVAVVGLSHVAGLPFLAETVHLPLGLVGFGAALAVTWPGLGEARSVPEMWRVPQGLAAPFVATLLLRAPAPAAVDPGVGLSGAERSFALAHGAHVEKRTLHGASVVTVASASWVAHHVPTWCLAGDGWVLSDEVLVAVEGHPARRVRAARGGERATVWFWFTDGETTTEDLAVRIREGGGRTWTLVAALVPDGVDPVPVLRSLSGGPS